MRDSAGANRVTILAGMILALVASQVAAPAQREPSDTILMQGVAAGSQTVGNLGARQARVEYSYNDRGRGDHIIATWKLDAAGVPVEYSGKGNDYMKAVVAETFRIAGGRAGWHNRSEHGERALSGEAFFIPANAPPEMLGVLARALLKAPGHQLPLLPDGLAHLDVLTSVAIPTAGNSTQQLTEYQISGLDFAPTRIWLDDQGRTAAILSGWLSVIRPSLTASLAKLNQLQDAAAADWSAQVAQKLTHVPTGDLLIRNARLFDPRDLSVAAGTSILIRGDRVLRAAPDTSIQEVAGTEVIDAHGQFVMPGLWDNHQHFGDNDGALDLINGVTSARDMANDTGEFLERVARFDAGTELGPRVFKAGIIDGTGPLAGPTQMRVDTVEQALQDVAWYADHGYGQIKIYSSVKPELVPLIADAAHSRGLRVSGHVPAFMSAQQFVEAGADEIQHVNFLVLNFLFDTIKDTRGTTRFTAVAEHAHEVTPDRADVQAFIASLKAHHTVLDPTLGIFEAMFCGDPAAAPPGLESVVPRFPAQVRRNQRSDALTVPKGQEAAYRQAISSLLRLMKAMRDAGITVIPGTDALAGYSLLHELELDARAGIEPAQVLRMATLTSAHVVGADANRGVIAPGKLADLILVDGDPVANISDLHKISRVIKGGHVYDPAAIESALGIAPRP